MDLSCSGGMQTFPVPVEFHSFIHSGDLYRASSRHYYSEALRVWGGWGNGQVFNRSLTCPVSSPVSLLHVTLEVATCLMIACSIGKRNYFLNASERYVVKGVW